MVSTHYPTQAEQVGTNVFTQWALKSQLGPQPSSELRGVP